MRMKIDINTPQDQLLKYQKSCGTAFGWLLGIGIVTFPVGIVPIGFALYFHSQKKKAAALIAQARRMPSSSLAFLIWINVTPPEPP